MPLTMKPSDKNCMKKCMDELTYKSSEDRPQEQKVAICLKQCGQSNQDFKYEQILNIDCTKQQKKRK